MVGRVDASRHVPAAIESASLSDLLVRSNTEFAAPNDVSVHFTW